MRKKFILFVALNISAICCAADPDLGVGICSLRNKRLSQEDAYIYGNVEDGCKLYAVFDGHGGNTVSRYLKEKFASYFNEALTQHMPVDEAFKCVFERIDKEVLMGDVGSTAVAVYIDSNNNKAHFANIGDSRAVLERNKIVEFSTHDHTPMREDERTRILSLGGVICRERALDTNNLNGPWRVNGLMMTRAIGDSFATGKENGAVVRFRGMREIPLGRATITLFLEGWPNIPLHEGLELKPQVGQIIAQPECTEIELTAENRWLILASDGLWDTVKNEAAIAFVQKKSDEQESVEKIAILLAEYAIRRGSEDNITVMLIDLLALKK